MARRPRVTVDDGQPYLSPATGGEQNPFYASMKMSPAAVDDLRELGGGVPVQVAKPSKKSIINTATRGDEDKQRIATPWPFIHALEQRFGTPVDFDLAAEDHNAKAIHFFSPEDDALKQDWSDLDVTPSHKLAFLNPPFAHIKPWALGPKDNPKAGMLACRWLPRWTVMLVPASYSTDWFIELAGKVQRCAIPRMVFDGNTIAYPKDLVLIIAGFGVAGDSYWDWRVSYLQWCLVHGQAPDPLHAKGCSALIKTNGVASVLPDFANSPDPFWKG